MYNHDVKDEDDWYGCGLVQLLKTFVMTVLLYGIETWSLLDEHHNPLFVFLHAVFEAGLLHIIERPHYKPRHLEAV